MAREITNIGNDRARLARNALTTLDQLGAALLQTFADHGYFSGVKSNASEDAGITTFAPKPMKSSEKAERRFDKAGFIFVAEENEQICHAASARSIAA